jgi:antitoxin (DNA-binding transcriptional repressor) of toxin-antitoxin stability system
MRERLMQSTKVGIREFRENLSSYLESKTPVAITRHGATIGIYVPTKPKPSQADLEALRIAGEKMQELIAAAKTTEDELVSDFKSLRRERRMKKN